jgi:hypothetical protein
MKLILTMFTKSGLLVALLADAAMATDLTGVSNTVRANVATEAQTNTVCLLSGKPVNTGITKPGYRLKPDAGF